MYMCTNKRGVLHKLRCGCLIGVPHVSWTILYWKRLVFVWIIAARYTKEFCGWGEFRSSEYHQVCNSGPEIETLPPVTQIVSRYGLRGCERECLSRGTTALSFTVNAFRKCQEPLLRVCWFVAPHAGKYGSPLKESLFLPIISPLHAFHQKPI